jgi:DinB superfamily
MTHLGKPRVSEYPTRYQRYIDLVSEENVVLALEEQLTKTLTFLSSLNEFAAQYRYAKGKWSIKEVIGHLIDIERIFSLRVVRFSRDDIKTRIDYDIDKDDYVRKAGYHTRSWSSICQELEFLRKANLLLFKTLEPKAFLNLGGAGNAHTEDRMSVRAVLYTMLGHERHHLRMIRQHYLQQVNL